VVTPAFYEQLFVKSRRCGFLLWLFAVLFSWLLSAVAVDRFGGVGCVEVRFLIRARGHRCTTFYPPGAARPLPVCALRWGKPMG
jgi:hypothetical protein